ncbi:MAG: response regulator [Candidatus Omnitrophica bacterium]|nr:response regulator [Candidatus Omnitrophota bacterium]
MNILVVDDEVTILDLFKPLVEEKGHHVDVATDGRQAMELLSRHRYDVVFSDHNMPECTGVELIKFIKQNYPGTKTVLTTGYETMEDFFAKSIGADLYLKKPVLPKTIEEVLEKYGERP